MSGLGGVLRVSADSSTNQVKVSYDELTLGESDLRAALADIGYRPLGADPVG